MVRIAKMRVYCPRIMHQLTLSWGSAIQLNPKALYTRMGNCHQSRPCQANRSILGFSVPRKLQHVDSWSRNLNCRSSGHWTTHSTNSHTVISADPSCGICWDWDVSDISHSFFELCANSALNVCILPRMNECTLYTYTTQHKCFEFRMQLSGSL